MIKQAAAATITLLALATFNAPAANAQAALNSQGATGVFGNSSQTSNNFRRANSFFSGNQRLPGVRRTGLGGLSEIHGPTGRNGLPNTSLDSFVLNAGGHAEHIYGDEGADGIPPYFEFTKAHRINTGITGTRDTGLTTGHGSYLPDAWGGDEFVDGPEWSQSGSNGGNAQHWTQGMYSGADPGTPIEHPDDVAPADNVGLDQNGDINNLPYNQGSAGDYRGDQGPTAPNGVGDGGGGSGF
ncbi:MAG: hypothetical protein SGJ27_07600 [Candidatus Melainabacteria bacterium]|nr:hypothetical protein [Candidatus Melainabacteria bacterium]